MTCSFATFSPQTAEEGNTFGVGFCLSAQAGAVVSVSPGAQEAQASWGRAARGSCGHTQGWRRRAGMQRRRVCARPGGRGRAGCFSCSLDTRSSWYSRDRTVLAQGRGRPRGCPDLSLHDQKGKVLDPHVAEPCPNTLIPMRLDRSLVCKIIKTSRHGENFH